MDHRRIEDENVAELYATGRLPPEAEEEFEIHLLECRECRERVAAADELRDSLREVAAEDAARAVVQLGLSRGLARWSHAARRGLLAVGLLALAAGSAWLWSDRARLERELAEARAAAERPAPPRPAASGEETERLAQERSRLEEELRRERTAREELADRLARLARPQANAAIYSLGFVRGEEDEANVLELGARPEWIVLSLELPQVEHDTYRATLTDARGATVWQGEGLRPTASDTLTVLLRSDLLAPGGYRVHLEGVGKGGSAASLGEIPFLVRRVRV